MAKTIISSEQRARIVAFRGRIPASQVAQREGCGRGTVLKIWQRYAIGKSARVPHMRPVKGSLLTGQVLHGSMPIEPPLPEPLIEHGFRLHELGEHQCSWPLHGRDEDGRLRFCGAPRAKNRSKLTPFYCEFHAAKAKGGSYNRWRHDRNIEYMADYLSDPRGVLADDFLLEGIGEAA